MATGTGAQRRFEALAARGWSPASIGRAAGLSAAQVTRIYAEPGRVDEDLAGRAEAAYDTLWNAAPPQRTGRQRAAARAAQARAEHQGWAPPLAWDEDGEIDDPDAGPAEDWRRSERKTIPAAELVEDAEFVREHGHQSLNERAMRLGVSRDRLEHAYVRAGRRQAEATEREAG